MNDDPAYTVRGRPVPSGYVCRNIFSFCAFMAAATAAKRGGRPSTYIRECSDFMVEVVGRRLSVRDELPADYDWSAAAARESALAMMEYDD